MQSLRMKFTGTEIPFVERDRILMNLLKCLLSIPILLAMNVFAEGECAASKKAAVQPKNAMSVKACEERQGPWGWSLDLGGQYTWMSFTRPPTYSGNTGGIIGRLTYKEANSFYGQVRSIYNLGTLSSSLNKSHDSEWYSEVVGGYCFARCSHWSITPYAGIGFDFLKDRQEAHSDVSAITLHYRLYYALFGFDTRYALQKWTFGLQAECFPTFNQYLSIGGLSGAAWKLKERVGYDVRLPVGYKLTQSLWLEATPYYRFLPIGSSSVLSLPHRNLSQWGGLITFNFML